jgi:hypothetical protein
MLAGYQYALALYVVKERPVISPADIPETEIIFVNRHLSAPIRTAHLMHRGEFQF